MKADRQTNTNLTLALYWKTAGLSNPALPRLHFVYSTWVCVCSRVCVHGNLTPFEVRRGEQRERNKLLQRSRRRRGVSRGSGFRWGFFAVCLRSCLSDDDGDSANKPSKKRIQFIPRGKLHYQNTQCLFFFCDYNLRLIKYRSSLIVHWTETTELIYSLNVRNVRSCKLRI